MNTPSPEESTGVTVIIPAYNEAESLPETLKEIHEFFQTRYPRERKSLVFKSLHASAGVSSPGNRNNRL